MSVLEVKNDDDGSAIITYWRRKALKGKKKSQEERKKKYDCEVREVKKKLKKKLPDRGRRPGKHASKQ